MPEKTFDPTAARQVELVVCRLRSLSVLPSVADRFLSELLELNLTPASLVELIESDPALSVRMFQVMHEQGISFGAEPAWIREAVEKLSLRQIRHVHTDKQN